jgi:hypothetical protein
MDLMSIAEIVSEIDSYLSLLRAARDLLSSPVEEERPKRSPRGRARVKLSVKDSRSHSKTPARKPKPRLKRQELRSNAQRRVLKSLVPVSEAVHLAIVVDDEAQVSAAAAISPRAAGECVTPLPIRTAPTQRASRPKEIVRKEPDVIRPAIALGGAIKDRVVVVPAEQVRRQREEAARPPTLRQRVSVYGGRTAFEALFKDAPESPITSQS